MLLATRKDMLDLESATREQMVLDDAAMIANAGTNAAKAIQQWSKHFPPHLRKRFLVLAGAGKNGADAWVVADTLSRMGECVVLADFRYKHQFSGGALTAVTPIIQAKRFSVIDMGTDISLMELSMLLHSGTILVDGLVGTGAKGALRSPLDIAVDCINSPEHQLPTVALDIPSGLDADSGTGETILRADLTLAMGFVKRGFCIGRGPEVTGEIQCVDFGCPAEHIHTRNHNSRYDSEYAFGIDDAAELLRPRSHLAHKNSLGRVLLLAGSAQYVGAPFLAASGALRAGAGLVTLALPSMANKRQGDAALIVRELSSSSHFMASHLPTLEPLTNAADAILFGPGIGSNAEPDVLAALLSQSRPLVLDADALRLLAAHPELLEKRTAPLTLTPHSGEMAALMKAFAPQSETLQRHLQAIALSKATGATVVLKGARTVVCSADEQRCSFNLSGNAALATAGTGDVLAGIITAFAAQMPPADAARLGVFLHGLAADIYTRTQSPRGMIADDLPGLLPEAIRECSIW